MFRLAIVMLTVWILIAVSYSSPKKGVAYWDDNFMCDDFAVLSNISWWYDWRMNMDNINHKHTQMCSSNLRQYESKFIPMVWSYYRNTVLSLPDKFAYILGFNEPNHKEQANLTPQSAATYWANVESASRQMPLVSPSAARCGAHCISSTTEWFDAFFANCTGCRIDYLSTHAYYCNADDLMNFLHDLYKRYGKKIWLTEFACANHNNNPAKQLNFMKAILPRLEEADYIYRYSWYMARIQTPNTFVTSAASLLEANSSTLTPLGVFYNNYEPPSVIVG